MQKKLITSCLMEDIDDKLDIDGKPVIDIVHELADFVKTKEEEGWIDIRFSVWIDCASTEINIEGSRLETTEEFANRLAAEGRAARKKQARLEDKLKEAAALLGIQPSLVWGLQPK